MHDVELEPLAELLADRGHVAVHARDPGDERIEVVLGEVGLGHAMHDHAVPILLRRTVAATASEHVNLRAGPHELLGQLPDVSRKPTLDDWRVLPRKDQDTLPHAEREATDTTLK